MEGEESAHHRRAVAVEDEEEPGRARSSGGVRCALLFRVQRHGEVSKPFGTLVKKHWPIDLSVYRYVEWYKIAEGPEHVLELLGKIFTGGEQARLAKLDIAYRELGGQ